MDAAPLAAAATATRRRTLGLDRPTVAHLLVLTLFSLPAYLFLPLGHGLTNTQESLRALTAHEMSVRGEWIVPTIHDQPYLNKPPLIYWSTMALAALGGKEAGVLDLRLVVALVGWLGVLATYACGRELLRARGERYARDAALWGSIFLATAILHVRAARTGELDILLVPLTAIAVLTLHRAWVHRAQTRRTAWGWIAMAALASAALALTKGPPGMLPMVAAAYGGVLLWAAFLPGGRPRPWTWPALSLSAIAGVLALRISDVEEWRHVVGLAAFALLAPAAAALLLRLTSPARLKAFWSGLHATHVAGVLLAGAAAFALWGWAVMRSIGRDVLLATAEGQARANVNVLDLGTPVKFIEALPYGAGMGSMAAIAAGVWLLRDRPLLHRGAWMLLGWAVLGVALQASLGSGSTRYLTAYWPGICLLGGWWFANLRDDYPREAGRLAAGAAIVAIGFATVQAWWYGHGREYFNSDRSPRGVALELRRIEGGPVSVATLDFWSGAIDLYAGASTLPVEVQGGVIDYPHPPAKLRQLRQRLRRGERWVVLARAAPSPDGSIDPGRDVLSAAGLRIEPIPLAARYEIDKDRTPVEALRVSLPRVAGRIAAPPEVDER